MQNRIHKTTMIAELPLSTYFSGYCRGRIHWNFTSLDLETAFNFYRLYKNRTTLI